MATRRTQPYRKGVGRAPGPALSAMLRGQAQVGVNAEQVRRNALRLAAAARRRRMKR